MISGVSAAHHISLPGLLTLTSHMMEAGQNLLSRPSPELFLSERHVKIDKEQTSCRQCLACRVKTTAVQFAVLRNGC